MNERMTEFPDIVEDYTFSLAVCDGMCQEGIVLFMLSYSVFIMCVYGDLVFREYIQPQPPAPTIGCMAEVVIRQYLLHLQSSICITFRTQVFRRNILTSLRF